MHISGVSNATQWHSNFFLRCINLLYLIPTILRKYNHSKYTCIYILKFLIIIVNTVTIIKQITTEHFIPQWEHVSLLFAQYEGIREFEIQILGLN